MPSLNVFAVLDEIGGMIASTLPRIRGLESLSNDQISEETRQFILADLARWNRLLDLYEVAQSALEALDRENFPEVPNAIVPAAVAGELRLQQDAINVAIVGFTLAPPAVGLVVSLGEPSLKPTE